MDKELENEEAKPINCLKECTKYAECYPFVNPILCSKKRLFEPEISPYSLPSDAYDKYFEKPEQAPDELLLTLEEIGLTGCDYQKDILDTGEIGKFGEAIAQAQLAKVVRSLTLKAVGEWLEGYVTEHKVTTSDGKVWRIYRVPYSEADMVERGEFPK